MMLSMATRPCLIGLRALRPRRLFGLDGTTGGAPRSPTVFKDPGHIGLPPATAIRILCESRLVELQGHRLSSNKLGCVRGKGKPLTHSFLLKLLRSPLPASGGERAH